MPTHGGAASTFRLKRSDLKPLEGFSSIFMTGPSGEPETALAVLVINRFKEATDRRDAPEWNYARATRWSPERY